MTRDRGYAFAVAALGAAVAALGILAFAPLTTTHEVSTPSPDQTEASTTPEPIEERRSTSIIQEQGWGTIAHIAVPVLLVAAMPLVAPMGRRGRVLRYASTVLLFGGVVIGAMSVGMFLLPAAILMLIAAVRSSGQP